MKNTYTCAWCGSEISRYPSQVRGKKMIFCSRACLASYRSKEHNPDGRPITRHPHLSEYNRQHNAERMTSEVRKKLRDARLGTGRGEGYGKWYGRSEHRVVVERILGRPLRTEEVVHHINGDKRDNRPENLAVMSQSEHTALHAKLRREARERCSTNPTPIKNE